MFIQIATNPDGSHAFQVGGVLEDGWAVVPEGMELPATFPFVNIEVAEVTHPAITTTKITGYDDNGEPIEETYVLVPEYVQLEVTSMIEGEEITVEQPDPEPTTEERIAALEEENAMLRDCILEMSEIVYA